MLKDGEVVGLGTHGELMETCEVYRAIAESQMKDVYKRQRWPSCAVATLTNLATWRKALLSSNRVPSF